MTERNRMFVSEETSALVTDMMNTTESHGEYHIEVNIALFLVLAILAFLIIGANTFAVVVICSSKSLQNVTGYMMISLAVADLGMGVSTALPLIYAIFSSSLTSQACDIIGFLHSISWVVSVFTLTLLGVDRYIAILYPLHYETLVTILRSSWAISFTWMFGALLWVLPLCGIGRFRFNDEEAACYFDLVKFPLQWIVYSVLVFLPTSAVIIFCYASMWKVSMKQRSQMEANMSEQATSTYHKNIKPVRTLILIIGAFYVAWLPFFIEHLVKAIKGKLENVPEWLEIAILVLAINNSFWNPIIYMKTNSKFRQAGLRILNKVFCCNTPVGPQQEDRLSTVA